MPAGGHSYKYIGNLYGPNNNCMVVIDPGCMLKVWLAGNFPAYGTLVMLHADTSPALSSSCGSTYLRLLI